MIQFETSVCFCLYPGYFSDDGNSCLALAESLVKRSGLFGADIALSYATAWKTSPVRGYPPTAKVVLEAVLKGEDYRLTGKPPYFPFKDGSFANGGAMRISPLAIAFRNADDAVFRRACAEAIRSSHVHPEAIDGAVVQATAVRRALRTRCALELEIPGLLAELVGACGTAAMADRISALAQEFAEVGGPVPATEAAAAAATADAADTAAADDDDDRCFATDLAALERLVPNTRPGSGLGFQIAAIDALPCVLWFFCRYGVTRPTVCLQRAVSAGGDTDTVASMVGAIVGALHGKEGWMPRKLFDGLENGERGRDYALGLAKELAALDLTGYIEPGVPP